ncbi:hypothetical protein [Arthrobacter sp. NicSoilC5]|uniref:hypothetical protein n=1 Tax=Arthrobacter sp. NicSoilC5 TaxID=2831000 RepID=UPI001CC48ED2|nr:hypothetical protein [Arthrobacter sp. NicSoilC5]BCW80507.1 hypothetical protein NicSoilC5_25260 [Arthrobacter sp. NicSoilC5]
METQLSDQSARPKILAVTHVLARIYLGLSALGTLYLVGTALLSSGAVPIKLPVRQFWPQVPEGVDILDGPSAQVAGGGFTYADVEVLGLGADVRLLLAAGYLLQGLVAIAIAVAVLKLTARAKQPGSFQTGLGRALRMAGSALILGGIAWQICFSVAGSVASQQVLAYTSWGGPNAAAETVNGPITNGPLGVAAATGFSFEFWPILVGIVLLATSAGLRYTAIVGSVPSRAISP